MGARIYVLITSQRLPAGLLTAEAWRLLGEHPVLTGVESPTLAAVREAGVAVELVPGTAHEQVARVRDAGTVVWIAAPDGDPDFSRVLAGELARHGGAELEMVFGSWDPDGARLLDVVEVMDRLRSSGGCPWDAEQTHASLMPYLLEEAYEAYDAISSGDRDAMVEELGDVLLQTVFHARLGQELDEPARWSIDDVAAALVEKLITRHPHVFAGREVEGAEEVMSNWEEIKRAEKSRESALDGVARSQPALSLARKYVSKAKKFDVDVVPPALPAGVIVPDNAEALGELLLSIVAKASEDGLDPEAALRAAADRYAGQVRAAEANTRAS